MILTIYALLFICVGGVGGETPLFATVSGLVKNDTLNIRKNPDYKSAKVGALFSQMYVGVERCRSFKHSIWCKVYHLAQNYENFKSGWVNAKYLKTYNKGYVIIDGKPNCDYVLRCVKSKCEIVQSYETNKKNKISALQTKWIEREHLKAASHFGAMSPKGEGYCTNGNYIQEYLREKRLRLLPEQTHDEAKKRAIIFAVALSSLGNSENILSYLHPKKGIVMTWNVLFGGKEDMCFGYSDIKNIKKNRHRKIDWGQTYVKGDDVFMSLYDYMKMMTGSIADISRVEKLKDLKGFHCSPEAQCRGYEMFWINETSDSKEYDWLGLVVILEKYHTRWYVVAILRDRWTI